MKTFEKGQTVIYKGTGFLGYDKSKMFCIFDGYEGSFHAYIIYLGYRVLVSKYDIEYISPKLAPGLNPDGTISVDWLMLGKK